MNAAVTPAPSRHRETVRATLVGSAVDLTLGVAKLVGGWLTQSQALIADGVHSLSDLATDAVVVVASRHASRAADADHPYGHGRIETVATVVLALVMVLVAGGIAYDSIQRLVNTAALQTPAAAALAVAAVSVLAKEGVYHYIASVARRLDSDLLRASAWHSRSDALSSVVVVLGVGGALLGYPFLDVVAALMVALMIAHVGARLAWSSVQELIDAGLSRDHVKTIHRLIRETEGVDNLHMLRTRSLGHSAMADVHIQVQPRISVSEGHQISESVRRRLVDEVGKLADVTVHTDPEDDLTAPDTEHLPARSQILHDLTPLWAGLITPADLDGLQLHYLQGRVILELTLPLVEDDTPARLAQRERRLRERLSALGYVGGLDVRYYIGPPRGAAAADAPTPGG